MTKSSVGDWYRAAGRVFRFYFFLARRAVRTRLFVILGLVPVALAVIVRVVFAGKSGEVMAVFNDILITFFLQFYIVVLSLFYGTSICAEEIENKTLHYIATRPVSRSSVIAGKSAAYILLQTVMVITGLTVSYLIMNAPSLKTGGFFPLLLRSYAALFLGTAAYTAVYAFLGTVLKRSLIIGLIFGFGWENVIQYFPGSTQKLSVVHYLKSLLPYRPVAGGKLSFLLFRLEPTSPLASIATLIIVTAFFTVLACLVFSWKEYRFDE